jgi:hypothetical protein
MRSVNLQARFSKLTHAGTALGLALGLVACSGNRNAGTDAGAEAEADAQWFEDDAQAAVDSSHDVGTDTMPVACDTSDVGSIWGRVYDQETFDPLIGVSVCIRNQASLPCATSDDRGIYAIPCVPTGDAEIEYVAAGYPRELWAWSSRLGVNEDVNLGIHRMENHMRFLAPSGEAFPDGTRSMITIDFIGNAVGSTVALRRGTGAGPFYTRYEGGTLDPAITQIDAETEYAYFIASPMPGEEEIEIIVTPGPGASRCTQYYGGWTPSDGAPNVMRIPVDPDAISVIFLVCE